MTYPISQKDYYKLCDQCKDDKVNCYNCKLCYETYCEDCHPPYTYKDSNPNTRMY